MDELAKKWWDTLEDVCDENVWENERSWLVAHVEVNCQNCGAYRADIRCYPDCPELLPDEEGKPEMGLTDADSTEDGK